MTRPTARVLALLEILQSGGTRTAGDLAARLGVDERTVRRYVTHLTDLDIPVRSLRGRYGGYHLASGYRMPPLMLTEDEALAVLLGLSADGGTSGPTGSAAAAQSAAAKVRRVLPRHLAERLDALAHSAGLTLRTGPAATTQAGVLLLLAEAAQQRRPVAVGHTASNGTHTQRTVHPYGLVAHAGRWYVTGADSTSGQVRTFRVDRITRPTMLEGAFEVPDAFDPLEQVLSTLARAPHRHEVRLRVQGSARQVRARLPAGIATVDDDVADGWVRVQMQVEQLDWVPGVLAAPDRPFTVERPDALRDLLADLAGRLATAADLAADRVTDLRDHDQEPFPE